MASSYFDDAIAAFVSHEAVLEVVGTQQFDDGRFLIEARFNTNLPSRWAKSGESPDGVHADELVQVRFPSNYPDQAPHFSLREDFNSTLPHINPHCSGERIPPCILAGSTLELLHSEGLGSLINQMAEWLKNAGRGSLINLEQGWEPTRRDNVNSFIYMDPEELLQGSRRYGQHQLFVLDCFWVKRTLTAMGCHHKRWSAAAVTERELRKLMADWKISSDGIVSGQTFLAVCWPSPSGGGEPDVLHTYLPDSVSCMTELVSRAAELGGAKPFGDFCNNLTAIAKKLPENITVPVFVIFPVRRPADIIGFTSNTEFIAYKVNVTTPKMFSEGSSPVSAVAFLNPTNEGLLKRTSGFKVEARSTFVTYLGCGSVGSKLAMHSARAGFAPALLIDKESLAPHNVARHALLPRHCSVESKARALASEIENFGLKKPQVFDANIVNVDLGKDPLHARLFDGSALLVNTTGSHAVRQFLASSKIQARIVEGCLTFQGLAGIFLSEGGGRNPNCSDVMSVAYNILRSCDRLAPPMDQNDSVLQVGVGCNSVTLPMSDTRVSLLSAGMSQALFDAQLHGLSSDGKVSVGQVGQDGMSVNWRHQILGKTQFATVSGLPGWSVRILDTAHRKILEDLSRYPGVESGGLIVGRCSPTHREVTIIDVLDAPLDSRREANVFVLGVEGLADTVIAYNNSGKDVLWCLGTWHSHLIPSGPSTRDKVTSHEIQGLMRGATVMLIRHPMGYEAIVAQGST